MKKKKKNAGDIIILHLCTKSHNHMKYSSWDAELDIMFLSFWAVFCHPLPPPPLPPSNPENQIFEKMKKVLDMSSFFIFATKHTIIWCMLTQIWSATDIFFHHFRSFFTLLPHYWHQKWKFGKNIKKYPEISRYHHLTQVSQKSWSYALLFLRYGAWWM